MMMRQNACFDHLFVVIFLINQHKENLDLLEKKKKKTLNKKFSCKRERGCRRPRHRHKKDE